MGFAIAGAIGGALIASNASQNAANTEADAANHATATQQGMFNMTNAQSEPYRQAGYGALNQMQDPKFQQPFTMAQFQQDPGYAFQLQQGQQALQRTQAANGSLQSGGAAKAMDAYSQGLASTDYQNAFNNYQTTQSNNFNRLASVAGLGQTANAQTAQTGMNAANNISQNQQAAGNAQAAGQIGTANAITGAIGQGTNTWMQYQQMNNQNNQNNQNNGWGGNGMTSTGGGGSVQAGTPTMTLANWEQ